MMYALGYTDAATALLDSGFAVPNTRAAEWARQHAGELITGIDDATRKDLAALAADALANPEMTAAEWGAAIGDLFDGYATWRTDMIANTEVALAANSGQINGFRDTGIQYVEVSDGEDFDEECQAADGATWSIDDAEANPLEHPNCTRSFSALDPASTNPDDVSSPE